MKIRDTKSKGLLLASVGLLALTLSPFNEAQAQSYPSYGEQAMQAQKMEQSEKEALANPPAAPANAITPPPPPAPAKEQAAPQQQVQQQQQVPAQVVQIVPMQDAQPSEKRLVPADVTETQDGLSLQQAFAAAAANNPTLDSARQAYYAVAENVALAVSGYRPDLSLNGSVTNTDIESEGNSLITSDGNTVTKTGSIDLAQPIFRGGSTLAKTREAKNTMTAQYWILKSTYQRVFLDVATAFWNQYLAQDIVALRRSNLELLQSQNEETTARFNAGELTKTDTSQSAARVAQAEAELSQAEAAFKQARATLEKLIRVPADHVATPEVSMTPPPTVEEALDIAGKQNPRAVASRFIHNASIDNVKDVTGELFPQIDLAAQAEKSYDPLPGFLDSQDTQSIQLRATIPLYSSGATRSRLRQAKYGVAENRANIVETEEAVRADVIAAWETYQAALSEIKARKQQVEAAEVALEGVSREEEFGLRTINDRLDANQDLLSARVAYQEARSNAEIAAFQTLYAVGELDAAALNLADTLPNNDEVMDKIGGNWFGLGVDYQK
ncbi:MAG: TolC family outer membrane protein [Pseudobdellovibrionaceae bacterium]